MILKNPYFKLFQTVYSLQFQTQNINCLRLDWIWGTQAYYIDLDRLKYQFVTISKQRCIIERMANSKCKQTNADFCFTFCTVHGERSIWDDIGIWFMYLNYRLRLSQSHLPHHNTLNTDTINKINKHTDTFLSHWLPFFLVMM